jgi:Tol biopolymer transport system component
MKKSTLITILLFATSGLLFLGGCGGGGGDSSPGPIMLVSVNSSGVAGSDDSEEATVSRGGRYVAFVSSATGLVTDDTNGDYDIFLHDVQTGITSRVSVSTAGSQGGGPPGSTASYYPDISYDGWFVAFEGEPVDFVPGDTNDTYDIFLRDTLTPLTTRVSVSTAGSEGDSGSYRPAISGNGKYLAFHSASQNLVPGGPVGMDQVFLRDTQSAITSMVSVSSAGTPGDSSSNYPDVSSDGRYVVFESSATNLVPGVSNVHKDIYLHDTQTGITSKVSVSTAGSEANSNCYEPAISGNGRYVVFISGASNLVPGDDNTVTDIFLRDVQAGTTTRVSVSTAGTQAGSVCWSPDISEDGRYVVWESNADNLVPDDNNGTHDIFVRDTQNNTTSRISVNAAGEEGNGDSNYPAISADGRYVVFDSNADNLVSTPADLGPPGTRHIYRAPVPQ